MQPVSITGPAGALEAAIDAPLTPHGALAVLCHPHPLYGGSMHDAVLGLLTQALGETGINCLRFNFRGVGASDGGFDSGRGEADDLHAVVTWARAGGAGAIWLAGYSFGAHVVCAALDRIADPARVLLVAPPTGVMDVSRPAAPYTLDVFTGDRDEFVDHDELAHWPAARIHVIAGADHFFNGSGQHLLDALKDAVAS